MFKLLKRLFYTCTVFLMVMPLVSCCGGGSGTAGTTGTLSIGLTDAPAGYDAIYVTIEEISVHHEVTGWETILTLIPVQTLNLLDLVGGDIHDLGVAELKAGHYNQMRLKLSTEHDDAQNIREELHKYAKYGMLVMVSVFAAAVMGTFIFGVFGSNVNEVNSNTLAVNRKFGSSVNAKFPGL